MIDLLDILRHYVSIAITPAAASCAETLKDASTRIGAADGEAWPALGSMLAALPDGKTAAWPARSRAALLAARSACLSEIRIEAADLDDKLDEIQDRAMRGIGLAERQAPYAVAPADPGNYAKLVSYASEARLELEAFMLDVEPAAGDPGCALESVRPKALVRLTDKIDALALSDGSRKTRNLAERTLAAAHRILLLILFTNIVTRGFEPVNAYVCP